MVTVSITIMLSKRDALLDIIFAEPKRWHFEELRRRVPLGKPQLARWLRQFCREGILRRVKPEGKMPYYVQNADDARFRNRKRLFGLAKLLQSGLLDHLASLRGAAVVVVFGSFSRWDWYGDSDIDVFVYGDSAQVETSAYGRKLRHDIEIHAAKDAQGLKRLEQLLPSVLCGYFVKGAASDLGVDIRAAGEDA